MKCTINTTEIIKAKNELLGNSCFIDIERN